MNTCRNRKSAVKCKTFAGKCMTQSGISKTKHIGNKLQLPFLGGGFTTAGSGAGVFAVFLRCPHGEVGAGFRSALPSSQMPGPCGARVSAGG